MTLSMDPTGPIVTVNAPPPQMAGTHPAGFGTRSREGPRCAVGSLRHAGAAVALGLWTAGAFVVRHLRAAWSHRSVRVGAAVLAWRFARPRAGRGPGRDGKIRELDVLRARRASWAREASVEEARALLRELREGRERLSGLEIRLEEAAGAGRDAEETARRLDADRAALAVELVGLGELRRNLEPFKADPEALLGMDRDIGAKRSEAQSLRADAAGAEGRLSGLPASDAAGIEERLAVAREELERARRRSKMLDSVADALGEARRRMSGTLASRLPALAATRLAEITGGRYGALFVDPLTLAVEVVPAAADIAGGSGAGSAPERVSPDALSQGARDQLYLAMRLALIDLLGGVERLPVFLDDPFVHFDPERRGRAVGMLRAFASSHQVVLFTCDPAYRAIGGRLVELRR